MTEQHKERPANGNGRFWNGRSRISSESSLSIGVGVLVLGGVIWLMQAMNDLRDSFRAETESLRREMRSEYASKTLVEYRLDQLSGEIRALSAKMDRISDGQSGHK